jgi:hypothetical protein
MSLPPSQENLPDELIEAYRRASAADGQRPAQHVRETILARARHLAHAAGSATEHATASATPAANDSQWKWKAAAGLAAVGLTGLLAVQTFRTAPHGPTSADGASVTENAQHVAQATSGTSTSAAVTAPVSAPAPNRLPRDQFSRSYSNAASPHPHEAATAPTDAAAAPREVAPPAPAAAAPSVENAGHQEAFAARVQSSISALAMRATTPAPNASRDKAIAAVRASFPELFTESAMTGTVRIAMVLNSDGTVYRTVSEEPVAAGHIDAASQLSRALGIGPDELDGPAELLTLNSTADQPNTIVVAFGIRRHNLGTSSGAP